MAARDRLKSGIKFNPLLNAPDSGTRGKFVLFYIFPYCRTFLVCSIVPTFFLQLQNSFLAHNNFLNQWPSPTYRTLLVVVDIHRPPWVEGRFRTLLGSSVCSNAHRLKETPTLLHCRHFGRDFYELKIPLDGLN